MDSQTLYSSSRGQRSVQKNLERRQSYAEALAKAAAVADADANRNERQSSQRSSGAMMEAVRDPLAVFVALVARVLDACCRLDRVKLTVCYVLVVFGFRVFLRSAHAHGMPDPLVMALEDGMSIMSFAVGLVFLHKSSGAPLWLLTGCLGAPTPDAPAAEEGNMADSSPGKQPLVLFYFAM